MSITFQKRTQTHTVDCYRSLNLLAHAQLEELDIGSQCGGHGICGGDRIRVTAPGQALSPVTEAEREHLGAELIAQGWRLGCQCFPQADGLEISVEVPLDP